MNITIHELFMKKYIHENSSTFFLWIKIHDFKMSNNKFIASSWTFQEHFMNIIHELFKEKSWIIHDHLAGAEIGPDKHVTFGHE